MMTEFSNTYKQYSQEAESKTAEENAKRSQEMQTTEQTIAQYRQNALQDLQKKEVELLKPVYEKARVAVQKVARAKGFDYVIDSTTGTGVILADGYDLMADVKKDLGI
jgi:outer membrane protein